MSSKEILKWFYRDTVIFFAALVISIGLYSCSPDSIKAKAGDKIAVEFIVEKKMKPGVYEFDFENSPGSNRPLCFCLIEKNTFPPDCKGDVVSLAKQPGNEKSVPSKIGTGSCSIKPIDCGSFASKIVIDADYSKKEELIKIVIEIKVPGFVKKNEQINFMLNWYRQEDDGTFKKYRSKEKIISII